MDSPESQGRLKKVLSNRSPRTLSGLALLALVPAVAFGLGKDLSAAAVTAVNVVLIFASIYLLVSPVEGDDGHGSDGHETDDATDSAV